MLLNDELTGAKLTMPVGKVTKADCSTEAKKSQNLLLSAQ